MSTRKIIPIAAAESSSEIVSLYQSEGKIQMRSVSGWFASWRWALVWFTQILFYGLPWLQWNERQAVLFDLGARRFYIFGLVLHPQDVIYLTGLLILSAYALFLFTAVAGRLWCGFACPQTVYTEIFMWVERRFEGDRQARIKLDAAPWSLNKFWRKGGKQLAWLADRPVDRLHLRRLLHADPVAHGRGLRFGRLRARAVGNVLDPVLRLRDLRQRRLHARAGLQVHVPLRALPERDVRPRHADHQLRPGARRAARLARPRRRAPASVGKGDCINCTLCVQVCPTGIDIRDGLQYECIGCAACIDVCDSVMDKMNYPRGLIRYATQNGMEGGWTGGEDVAPRGCGRGY